ncbi:MAG: ABC-type transporter, integral rane subunit, partial [Clostridia bacterium]|nr:ABC-type transporter, integral rane subunit [Clostridia bacterium]
QELFNLQYLMYNVQSKISNLAMITKGGNVNLKDIPSETARMALAIVAIGPIILAYPFFQRYFEKGISLGATKE